MGIECELDVHGFNKVQEEAMFDFGFLTYDEWESVVDYNAGIFDSTLLGKIKLTNDGKRVLEELEKKIVNLKKKQLSKVTYLEM